MDAPLDRHRGAQHDMDEALAQHGAQRLPLVHVP